MNYRTTPITLDVQVQLYPGTFKDGKEISPPLILDGVLSCSVEATNGGRPIIDNYDLRVQGKREQLVEYSWDDLSDVAQEKIDRQVLAYFDIDVAA